MKKMEPDSWQQQDKSQETQVGMWWNPISYMGKKNLTVEMVETLQQGFREVGASPPLVVFKI